MASLREMLERRATLKTELETLHKATPEGALPEAAQVRWDKATADLNTLEAAITRQSVIDDLDSRASGTPLDGGGGDNQFDALAARVSILDVLRAQTGGRDEAAGRAVEVSQELARRSGRPAAGLYWDAVRSTSVARARMEQRVFGTLLPAGGAGGALIQTDVAPQAIDLLAPKLITARLGATILSGLVGNLAVPRVKQWPTVFWVAENAPLTVTDPGTEQVIFTPHHAGAVVELTRQIMQQAQSPDVIRLTENIVISAVAQSVDQAAIVGGGAGQPNGLLAAGSGIGNVPLAAVGGPPTWNAIVAMIAAVDQSNALDGRLGFAGNAKVTSVLRRTLKSSADTSSNFIMGNDPNSLAGYPYLSSQNVPSNLTKSTGTNLSALIFGDFSALTIGYWSAIDLAINTQGDAVFRKGNAQIRAMVTCDIQLRHPQAFAAITDMVTI
jgi:HK97 family phage major capsid protein